MSESDKIKIYIANKNHLKYVDVILETIEAATKVRGTGIAKRSKEYIRTKMLEGKAIIALLGDEFAGFCYIETWGHEKFVANSGLIVVEKFREQGLAKKIKKKAFDLSLERFPGARLFGLTSGAAVMKINTELGYNTVTYADLTDDEEFWKGCEGCVNYDVLQRYKNKDCICRAMLYNPDEIKIYIANNEHLKYIDDILEAIKNSASAKDCRMDIAKRTHKYIKTKILEGEAIIAIGRDKNGEEKFAGFCYIESWSNKKFVEIAGFIVNKYFSNRGLGVSKKMKLKAFLLSRERFPNAKLFSLTPNVEAMKTNAELGYKPVTLTDLTKDEEFWEECKGCEDYDVLTRTGRRYCICKGMLYDPAI